MTEVTNEEQVDEPSLFKWAMRVAASAGLAALICCVAPMVLFMVGLMGGACTISFAIFSSGRWITWDGAWVLRGVAVLIGIVGFWLYRRHQNRLQRSTAQEEEPTYGHRADCNFGCRFLSQLRGPIIGILMSISEPAARRAKPPS